MMIIAAILTGLATGVLTFLICHALVYPSLLRQKNEKAKGVKIERAEVAIEYLADLGIINCPSHWHANYRKVQGLGHLLINAARIIKTNGVRSTSVTNAISNLESAGIICNPGYWEDNCSKLPYLDDLLMKLGGSVAA